MARIQGYDSAGIATLENGKLGGDAIGKRKNLETKLTAEPFKG
jgi:glucosamine 6-phosphate synthetase-like amidotransferase/phosphosugar isomerase protein